MKRLAELNIDELMSEFGKAGFQGEFTESLALVKLTIYLVSSGLDPFTFQFDISVEELIEDGSIRGVCEIAKEASEDIPSEPPFLQGLDLADGESAESLSEFLPSNQSLFVTTLEASLSSFDTSSIISPKFSGSNDNRNCVHLGLGWTSSSVGKKCNPNIPGNRNVYSEFTLFYGIDVLGPYSSGCGNCTVKTNEERPVVWPPDLLSVSHHWEC